MGIEGTERNHVFSGSAESKIVYEEQVKKEPTLRPLILTIKALLSQKGLMNPFTGGLSSFALALMAIAHLQELRKVSHQAQSPSHAPWDK